jgi:predicted nucleotide-binding protein
MATNDLFVQINNAVLDLQAAHLQSYDRPIRRLAGLLNHAELQAVNEALTENVDLNQFLKDSAETQGGMAGSASLLWPDDMTKTLGLTLMLIRRFGENPEFMVDIGHLYFYSGSSIMAGVQGVIGQIIVPFARDYKTYALSRGNTELKIVRSLSNKIFIVHGHDEGAREAVARFIMQLGFEPIILHEQASRGRTVIEKVEAHGEVSFAIVLLTPDDEGNAKGGTPEPRARQNVLLELGYFLGRLGRENVCALKRGQVEIPSDFAGVVWEAMDAGNGWKQSLGRELQAAGHNIDWNKVMR